MQKASVMKGSGLKPLEDEKSAEVAHVFGKNLEERVITNDEEESPSISSFNVVAETQNLEEDDIDSIRKRKFDAITGEEDEETIFQGDFKLFVWDLATSNWIEKGRGQLKLNDSIGGAEKKTRIIMRVSGTLRIILNVAVNRSFFRVIANSKTNIRFTDSQTVWAASGSNANQLKDLIEERLKISAEEENEIRKKSKSDTDDVKEVSSKKTKANEEEEDKQQPLSLKSNENESNNKDTSDETTTTTTQDSGDADEDEVAKETEEELKGGTEQDSKSPKKEEKLDIRSTEDNDHKSNGEETRTVENGDKS